MRLFRKIWLPRRSLIRIIRGRSLSMRFAIGASVVGAVPLVVTGIVIDRSNTTTVLTAVQRDHESALDQATVAIESSVESIFADLTHLTGSPVLSDLDAKDEELTAELERFNKPVQFPLLEGIKLPIDQQSPFEELALFRGNGTTEVAINYHFSSEWSTSKWMNNAAHGTVSYSSPHFDLERRLLVISIAAPVFSDLGEVVRIVGAQVDLGRVLSLADLDGFAVRRGIDLRLVDRFGNYLAGVPTKQLLEKSPPFTPGHVATSVEEFNDGKMAVVGGERSVGAGTIWAGEGWRIRSIEPASAAYAGIASARRDLAMGLSTGFILIVVMSLLVGRQLSNPLRRIAQVVTSFGEGDYQARLQSDSSDELGKVTDAFNLMADSLEHTHQELEESNRAKSEFISSLSHELRTPLAAMLGFVQILKKNKDSELGTKSLDHLEVINRNGRRLENMINDLLDLTKIENQDIRLDMNWFEISDVLEDITVSLENLLSARQQSFSLNIEHGNAWLHGDKNRIAQVLTNLISNASKYSDNGTTVTVNSVIEQDQLFISVQDRGQGIKPVDLRKLFTLFFRTEDAASSSTPGTGIGLFISKRMVELHGGTIQLESEYGSGTTVTVRLPGLTESIPAELVTPAPRQFTNRFLDLDVKAAS